MNPPPQSARRVGMPIGVARGHTAGEPMCCLAARLSHVPRRFLHRLRNVRAGLTTGVIRGHTDGEPRRRKSRDLSGASHLFLDRFPTLSRRWWRAAGLD
jgi:hypothetical protein